MTRVLIQCGDVLENRIRVLAVADRLAAWGLEPVVAVYTPAYAGFFEGFGVEAVALYDHRPATARLAAAALAKSGLKIDPASLTPFERAKAGLSGDRFDPGPAQSAALRALAAVDAVVRDGGIDQLIVWNGHTGAVANAMRVYKARRKLDGGFIERGLIRDAAIFDPDGVNGAASLANRPACDPETAARRLSRQAPALARHFPQLQEETFARAFAQGRRGARRILLVPLQVQRDTNVVLHSPRVRTMRMLALEALRLRRRLGDAWEIVVRPHPEEDPEERLNLPSADGMRVDGARALNDQLADAAAVMTVNSAVGLEGAFMGCAPIVWGEGVYCRAPFALRALDAPVDEARIAAWEASPADRLAEMRAMAAAWLDAGQLQPIDARETDAMEMAGRFAPLRGAASAAGPALRPRRALSGEGPVVVHAIGVERTRVAATYRDVDRPIGRAMLLRSLRLHFGDRPFRLEARLAPDRGDVAVIGPDVPRAQCGGYAVLMDHTGGLCAGAPKATTPPPLSTDPIHATGDASSMGNAS
jgi:hypothetical protein